MAFVQGMFFSEALGMETSITALLPEKAAADACLAAGRGFPSLYMLHGATGDQMDVVLQTEIAEDIRRIFPELAVIMPAGNFSFWTDYQEEYRYGHGYASYLSKELISVSRTLFPLSDRREDTAVYGVSMGGFGALGTGLNHPDTFGYVGSQSGMVDIGWAIDTRPFMTKKHERMFGSPAVVKEGPYDFYAAARKLSESDGPKPRLFQSWGEEDYLLEINENFHEYLKSLELDYTWHKIRGPHGWGIHGEGVRLFLEWFQSNRAKEGL